MSVPQIALNTKDVRTAAITRIIAADTAVGANVFNAKATPIQRDKLPGASVYTPSQQAEADYHVNLVFNRTVELQIDVTTASSVNAQDDVDDIMHEIRTALFEDPTWLTLYYNIVGYTETSEVEDDGDKLMAFGSLTITLQRLEQYNAGL